MKDKILKTFRAFQYRNYRLFFSGQVISLIGSWIQNIAISWLIYDITKSAFIMGTVACVNAIPLLVMLPFAGVISDKFNKHKLFIWVQIAFAIQAFSMAILAMTGTIRIWHIVVLGVFLNLIMAIDMPLRQAFVVYMVDDKKDLGNAISLNSSCFNLARLIGPAIAGVLISALGVGVCFFLNFVSYLPVIWAVCAMRLPKEIEEKPEKKGLLKDLKEGFSYAVKSPQISLLLISLAVLSFVGMSYPIMMPIFAAEVLHRGAETLGILMSAAGIGALLASLLLAYKQTVRGLAKILTFSMLVASLSFFFMGFSNGIVTAFGLMFGVGFGMVMFLIASNTLIQAIVDDDKRGRIMSLHAIAFAGTFSLSNMLVGVIAQEFGISNTFKIVGLVLFVSFVYFGNKLCRTDFKSVVKQ